VGFKLKNLTAHLYSTRGNFSLQEISQTVIFVPFVKFVLEAVTVLYRVHTHAVASIITSESGISYVINIHQYFCC
jgi:hypothetical protein